MSECQAGIGVAAGQVVAANVGAKERFEYTVIGEPVNEAARLTELAKSQPIRLLASWETVDGASENERAQWSMGETVTLRADRSRRRSARRLQRRDADITRLHGRWTRVGLVDCHVAASFSHFRGVPDGVQCRHGVGSPARSW